MLSQNFIIGILILFLGIPIGSYLAKITREELSGGQRWFRLITSVSLIGAIVSLILRIDPLLFAFLFILIITSRAITHRHRETRKNKAEV